MTHDEIEQLAGHALRVAVAEIVFGRRVFRLPGETLVDSGKTYRNFYGGDVPLGLSVSQLPAYESDIAAAFEVAERTANSSPARIVRIETFSIGDALAHRVYVFDPYVGSPADDGTRLAVSATHVSLPVAICRAALLAITGTRTTQTPREGD